MPYQKTPKKIIKEFTAIKLSSCLYPCLQNKGQIAAMIEANTINLLLLLLTILFNANLLYLCLEGTLSNVLIFYQSELLTIRKIENG